MGTCRRHPSPVNKTKSRASLVLPWLRIHLAMNAGEAGSTPGWSRKIPHALEQLSQHAAPAEALGPRAHAGQ